MENVDIFAIGNALLDTLVFVEDDFLKSHKIDKGIMTLIDHEKQQALVKELKTKKLEVKSGGSAANTMHGLSLCGGTGIFAGKVANDEFGKYYEDDLKKAGISLEATAGDANTLSTGACLVLISPDGERSMLTYLGISSTLSLNDFNLEDIKRSKGLYIEGYMWDGEKQKEACLKALNFARENGILRTMTFSDPFCVNRAHDEFADLCKNHLDVVFCNSEEVLAFTEQSDLDKAIDLFSRDVKKAFVTNSEKGAIVISNGNIERVPGFPVKVLDTTGAGDAFAAGTLYGLSRGYSDVKSARLGNFLGSKIVQKEGARLDLNDIKEIKEIENE